MVLPRRRRTPELEKDVLHAVQGDETTSIRRVASRLNVDQKTVCRILPNQQLHPYHPQGVQTMRPELFVPRVNFCRWFLQDCVVERDFPRWILFTDEAKFTRKGVINFRNSHVWANENSRNTRPQGFQQRYGFSMWARFVDGCVIESYLLPSNLTGDTYLNFLQHVLHGLLEYVPLHVCQNMWFPHDGSLPHFTPSVRGHLDRRFGQTSIGRGGPIA